MESHLPSSGRDGFHGDPNDGRSGMFMHEGWQGRHGHEATEEGDNGSGRSGPLVSKDPQNASISQELHGRAVGSEFGKQSHPVVRPSLPDEGIEIDIVERSVDTSDFEFWMKRSQSLAEQFKITHVRRDEDHAFFLPERTYKDFISRCCNTVPDEVGRQSGALQGREEIGCGMAKNFPGEGGEFLLVGCGSQGGAEIVPHNGPAGPEEMSAARKCGSCAPERCHGEQANKALDHEEGGILKCPLKFLEQASFIRAPHGSVDIR